MQDNQNHQLSASCSNTTRTQDQDLKMISDLWGAMMALFGELWTRSFGEEPDKSGQWRLTLSGISRAQIADAIGVIRNSGRKWPPAAPEFRAICLDSGKEKYPPLEICMTELIQFVKNGRRDTYNLSPFMYHTVTRNLDLYNYRLLEREYDRVKAFEVAYKATLFQLETGHELAIPPAPETLLESKQDNKAPADIKKGSEAIGGILAMFAEPEPSKPLTQDEIKDWEKLRRIKENE